VKGYFKKEAKFLLVWLLGVPFIVMVVALVVTIIVTRKH